MSRRPASKRPSRVKTAASMLSDPHPFALADRPVQHDHHREHQTGDARCDPPGGAAASSGIETVRLPERRAIVALPMHHAGCDASGGKPDAIGIQIDNLVGTTERSPRYRVFARCDPMPRTDIHGRRD
jgi:hypothetical protein